MPDPVAAAPAASTPAPASTNGASGSVKPSGNVVKPNPVGSPINGSKPGVAAAPTPEGTAPPPQQRFKRVEKIDGKEVTLEATEDELWASHRKGSTLDRRFEEVARKSKEIATEQERVTQMMKRVADPERLLSVFMEANPGADPIEVMSAILQKKLAEEEQLQDPNIRERRRLERENAGFKEREAQAKAQAETDAQNAQMEQAREEFAGKFGEALELTKLPKNDITLRLMAEAEWTNRKQGWALTPAQLAKATEKSVHGMIEGMLTNESVTDEQVLEFFPALTKRIHRGIVARFKAKQGTQGQQPSDLTPRDRKPSAEETPKQRVVNSADEHKLYGGKGLRTI